MVLKKGDAMRTKRGLRSVFVFLALSVILSFSTTLTLAVRAAEPVLTYQAHVSDIGWMDPVSSGETAGTTGQAKKLEALKIGSNLSNDSTIEYQSHVQDYGWMDWVHSDQQTGTTGEDKRLEAIRIRFSGSAANDYDLYYRAHVSDYGWLDWAKNGEESGSTDLGKAMEAIQIVVRPKGSTAPGATSRPVIFPGMDPVSSASEHIEGIGWVSGSLTGRTIGTEGQGLRLEALCLKYSDETTTSSISYMSHISDLGWETSWRTNGQVSGTTGQARAIESIRIKLNGAAAESFDIYYQAHCQDVGWLDWAKNGEPAGTTGSGLRLEALNVQLVRKGSPAPGNTDESFRAPVSVETFKNRIYGGWIDTVRADEPVNSYVCGISQNYMFLGSNQTYNGFEGYYEVLSANAFGGKIRVKDTYTNEIHDLTLVFEDIPSNHLKIIEDNTEREFVLGDTTDRIHYTFSGLLQYGQLAVLELRDRP